MKALQRYILPSVKPGRMYTDNSPAFIRACADLGCTHHRSDTHGRAESAVRRVIESTASVMVHSGLTEGLWNDAMKCQGAAGRIPLQMDKQLVKHDSMLLSVVQLYKNKNWQS